ncbi:glutathione synthetase-like [Ceratina calcarata]|uniref:Glutathione synthetase n=1 Tax=Ceratina calcarata TaxID=156304 RepID=A0AAJ7N4D1_9HYME|nr:glutathione synthetase-like [Ceratina calcarata]
MEEAQLQPCIKVQLGKHELESIVDKAKDWALMHGIGIRSKVAFNKNQLQVLPFTLLPSSFPKENFQRAKSIQTLLNKLMHKVAHNHDFLQKSLKSTVNADPFTARLFHIYETVYKEGFAQSLSLGLFRSDYMLHENQIKQVEFNTIASSFGGIVTVATQWHKYILPQLGYEDQLKNIPDNNPINGLSKGLTRAWEMYDAEKAVILFIVESITYNICDQRFHEFEIHKINPKIRVIRRNLSNLVSEAKLGPNKELMVGDSEVAVVYFRSGYEVNAYPTEREWEVRLLIERSRAIKCPSIQYHLAGTKKVQQSLAYPGALNVFVKDESARKQIQEVFTGLYSLEFNDEAEAIIDKAIAEPGKYVLKPQREGGGNNVYGEDVKVQLESMRKTEERCGWILMDRLYPPAQSNYVVRARNEPFEDNHLNFSNVVSELGVYGVVIGDCDIIEYNEEVGHILRTKSHDEDEGGIAAGIGAIDTPYLID